MAQTNQNPGEVNVEIPGLPAVTDKRPAALAAFLERNRFLLVFAVLSSLMGTSVGMAQVSASLYAVELGASELVLPLIAAGHGAGVLIMSLPAGIWVERSGPHRPFLVGTALAGVLYALIPVVHSATWLLACVVGVSLVMPLRFVSLNSVFLRHLASMGGNQAGWYRGTHMIGMFLVGPSLGGRLVQALGFAWTYEIIALSFALTLFVSGLVFSRYGGEREAKKSTPSRAVREQLGLLFRDREVRALSIIEWATQAVSAYHTFFIVVVAVSVAGMSHAEAASFVSAKGITFILALFVLGGMIERLGASSYLLSFAVIALGLGFSGLGRGTLAFWAGGLLLGLGLGSAQIATLTRYAQIGKRTGHGRIAGVSTLVGPTGGIAGSLLGGAIGGKLGYQAVFVLGSIAFALACVRRARKTAP